MTEFIEKYQKVPVTEYKNKVKNDHLVSVCVQTYQHVNYIRDCLDGILMQKTDFSFEILLGEDASTDGTREFCIEYAQKHPDKIRLFLHSRENNIKVNGQPTGRFNLLYNFSKAHGKYIALCEGDDYWTDPYKLQKQVDFLEMNAGFVLSYTNCDIFDEQKQQFKKKVDNYDLVKLASKNKKEIFYDIVNSVLLIRTATVVFRRKFAYLLNDNLKFKMGDTPLWLTLSQIGKFHYLDEPTATIRITGKSATQPGSTLGRLEFVFSCFKMYRYYLNKYNYSVPDNIRLGYVDSFLSLAFLKPELYSEPHVIKTQELDIKRKIKYKFFKYSILRHLFRLMYQFRRL